MEFECNSDSALMEYWERCSDYYDEDEMNDMSCKAIDRSYED